MAAAALSTTNRVCVLVVEDDPEVGSLICEALEEAGIDAHQVESDREAYALLGSGRRYAGLLVDINLGVGTTGFDVARFARQVNGQLPVIYISGQASEGSFRAFGVPGSIFLAKPLAPAELVRSVRILIGDNDS